MRLDKVPVGRRVRRLVDLEEGEEVGDLPTYLVCILDKSALAHTKEDHIPVLDEGGPTLTTMKRDTEVEVLGDCTHI